MLRSLKEIVGYGVSAKDGEIGRCDDFLFEDRPWIVRYLVAKTGSWLIRRQVLLPLVALLEPDWITQLLHVDLTKQQIEDSPPLREDEPVSRQYERQSFLYYGWPAYWEHSADESKQTESHLRSVREVVGYTVLNTDGSIGRVCDFIVADDIWAIRYMVVETEDRLDQKKVLTAPEWVQSVDWLNQSVAIGLSDSQIRNCPDYDPAEPVNREYETVLYDYYGRPYYWENDSA